MQVTIYGRSQGCSYCDKAKTLLMAREMEFFEVKIGTDIGIEEFRNYFKRRFNIDADTVPQIIINEQYIGGYDQLCGYVDRLSNDGLDKKNSHSIDLTDFSI